MDEQALTLTTQASHLMPAMSVGEAADRFRNLSKFVKTIMKEGIDYGPVPGTDKDTLLKPGAEKLTTFFGLRAIPTVIKEVEDWTGEAHGNEPFFYYWIRYSLYRGDMLIAEADGSCNSWESKYRYRWAERKCPTCGNTTIIKGKEEYGGGWLCWAKRGGCGAKFKDGDADIEGQELGRVTNPNPADLSNTILKMAGKRALVAATLLAVNASEFFTQDMEDLADNGYINGEIVSVSPTPQTTTKKPTNGGKYDKPEQRAVSMLRSVNEKTGGAYNAPQHLLNAIRIEVGDKEWTWPELDDEAGWTKAANLALAHAKKEAA